MNPSEVLKPNITEEMAKEIAFRLYGVEVISMKQLVSYDDKNFHIMVSPKHSNPYLETIWQHGYTLKFTNAAKSAVKGHFDSMHNIMKHMKKKGLRLPYPVLNLKGSTWTLEELPVTGGEFKDPCEKVEKSVCGIHMLTYIEGVPVGSVKITKDVLYLWGKLLAKFHSSLEDYRCPILEKVNIFWNLSHVPELKNFMEVLSESEAPVIQEVLENFPQGIYTPNSSVKTGLLHGDFNENNILARLVEENNGDKKYIVDGILDLEDMHYGPYIWDIGVMLAYAMLYCEDLDPIDGIAHAMAGYFTMRSLNREEISLLKICAASRLSQSYMLAKYSYRLQPTNSYLLCAQSNKWASLNLLWKTPDDLLLKKLEDISLEYRNLNSFAANQVI